MYTIANLCGTFSMIVMFTSYVFKKRTGYLSAQVVANFFYGLQFLLLQGYSAGITSLIGVGKNIWFYHYEKQGLKPSIKVLAVLETIYVIIGIITYNGLISLIPILISCVYTWAGWQANLKITCIIGFLVSILWVFYDLHVGAYVSIIASVVEAIACVIGLIKKIKESKQQIEV